MDELKKKIISVYTNEYYELSDLERDLRSKGLSLDKLTSPYSGYTGGDLPDGLSPDKDNVLSRLVKESYVKTYIKLTVSQNLKEEFKKASYKPYKSNFKEREADLLAKALAPAISKHFYPQAFKGKGAPKYIFGIDGLKKELRKPIYANAIRSQLESLYTHGYMYQLDEKLRPVIVDNRIAILEDAKGEAYMPPPMDDGKFKRQELFNFILSNKKGRYKRKSSIFSMPSSWKAISEWEKYFVATRDRNLWSAGIARTKNPALRSIIDQNTRDYLGTINTLASPKNQGLTRDKYSPTATGLRHTNRLLYPEKSKKFSFSTLGALDFKQWEDKFGEVFTTTNKRVLKINFKPFQIGLQKGKDKKNPNLVTRRDKKVKKRNLLKFIDFIEALPAAVVFVGRYFVDKALLYVAKNVGDGEFAYSILRNVSGGLTEKVFISIDSFKFALGVGKLILKDGVEALIPGLITGIILSNPLLGAVVGGAYFTSKFLVDFTSFFSEQNPLTANLIERINSSMIERSLSTTEVVFKSTTFGFSTGILGAGIAAFLGIANAPLIFAGIFIGTSAIKAIDYLVVGRLAGSYEELSAIGASEFRISLFKSEYLFQFGGVSGIVSLFFISNPFIGLVVFGAGLITGSVADFIKASLFEDSVLHSISDISLYDALHTGLGFAGGGALIGVGLVGGPLGLLVGVVTGGMSLAINIYEKRASSFIVKEDPKLEPLKDIKDLRLKNVPFNEWKNLGKVSLKEELVKLGIPAEEIDRMDLVKYLEGDKIKPDIAHVQKMFDEYRRADFYSRQDLLYRYDPLAPRTIFANVNEVDISKNLEENLKNLKDISGRSLDSGLVDTLSKDTNVGALWDKAIHGDASGFIDKVAREHIIKTSGLQEEDLKKIEKSKINLDNSRLRIKTVNTQIDAMRRTADIIKDPRAIRFIDEGAAKKIISKEIISNRFSVVTDTSVKDFFKGRGINIEEMKYSDFVEAAKKIGFSDQEIVDMAKNSDYIKNLSLTDISPDKIFEGITLTPGTRFVDSLDLLKDPNIISSSIPKLELGKEAFRTIQESGLGSVGKVAASMRSTSLITKLSTEDLMKAFNSGLFGGTLLSVAFGATTLPAFAAVTLGYTSFKWGLSYLENIDPKFLIIDTALGKVGVGTATKFLGESMNPAILLAVVSGYFLGPVAGIAIGATGGIGWAIFKRVSEKSFIADTFGKAGEFLGSKVMEPFFILQLDTSITSPSFWEALLGEKGGMAFLNSAMTSIFGGMAISSIALSVGSSVVAAVSIAGLSFALPEIAVTLLGAGIVVVGGVILNQVVNWIFGHGIMYYIGDFFKSAINTVWSWFSKAAVPASLGLDIFIGIILLFFKTEFDIDDFLKTIFIMVIGWSLAGSLIGANTASGATNNNTSSTVSTSTPATVALNTSPYTGKILNIDTTNPVSMIVTLKTGSNTVQFSSNNPSLYTGETLYKGEYLGN